MEDAMRKYAILLVDDEPIVEQTGFFKQPARECLRLCLAARGYYLS